METIPERRKTVQQQGIDATDVGRLTKEAGERTVPNKRKPAGSMGNEHIVIYTTRRASPEQLVPRNGARPHQRCLIERSPNCSHHAKRITHRATSI